MKLLLFTLLVSLLSVAVHAQTSENFYIDLYDNSGKRINAGENTNIQGSPYLFNDWTQGSVLLNDREMHNNIPLRFDIETNTLYFQKDSAPYRFGDRVSSFRMIYTDTPGHQTAYFKSGYPDPRGYPTKLLYQVITEGPNVSYVKYLRCHTEQRTRYGLEPLQVYVITQELWIYNAGRKRMYKIRRNSKSVEKAISDYREAAQKFLTEKDYTLETDEQISELIAYLNGL